MGAAGMGVAGMGVAGMVKMVVKRVTSAVLVLLVLIGVIFLLRQASPVDPARAIVGEKASAAVVAIERKKLGLDDPLPVQYVRYVEHVIRGDFGTSAVTRRPIFTNLGAYFPATLELILAAFFIAIILGVCFGIATSLGWRGAGILRGVMIVASSLPVFLTALLGIIVFYQKLGWLPATGRASASVGRTGPTGLLLIDGLLHLRVSVFWDAIVHLILPATCLALAPAVSIGRVLRSSLQHALRSDYVRTARATGEREITVLVSHALRNSAGPALAMGGIQLAALFGSVLVIEAIFAWPGLGLYTVQAIDKGDFQTIAGVTLCLGALYVVANIVVDLLQALADPRIRV
jgi:peptide/nickel transport system permease protein